MKKFVSKSLIALSLITGLVAIAADTTFAAPPPAPNLEVRPWTGSTTPLVESTYQYTTRVRNIGNQNAAGVIITVEFPLTNTSPNKFILGKLSGVSINQNTCSTAGNKIVCNIGNLGSNQQRTVTFNFEFQVATTAPTMKTTATTTSLNEVNSANNSLAFTPALAHPDNIVSTGTYLVSSCTGRGLTSFYECEVSPSSIQSVLSFDVDSGGTLAVTGDPLYAGIWDQNTLINKSLHILIPSEIDFNGFAVSGTCFEGITTFASTTVYNSAYRVCRQ